MFKVKDNLPNFDQFVEFVLELGKTGNLNDPHLNFFWRKCDMCKMPYDVIGKVETMEEDLNYIFSKLQKVWFK